MPQVMTKEQFQSVGDSQTYGSYERIGEMALEYDHKHWIDGTIPANPRLAAFFAEFKHKRRNIVPKISAETVERVDQPDEGNWYRSYTSIGIAYASAPEYRVGTLRVNYNSDNEVVFEVESDLIENEKFRRGSDGYRIKRTRNFAAAVKTALTYLKPMTVGRLMQLEKRSVINATYELRSPAQDKLHDISGDVKQEDVLSELAHMVATGYIPVTAHFANAVAVMRNQGAELRRLDSYCPRECWVWGRHDGTVAYQFEGDLPCEVASVTEVPEFIRDKIAVLQITDKLHAILDVGVKVNDKLFCVFV